MANYTVKTIFPADESTDDNKYISNKRTELQSSMETGDVVALYNQYLEAGYDVNVSFNVPETNEDGSDIESDPFEMAENLTKQGIDYKAKLKLDAKGAYDDLLDAMHLIESAGYAMVVDVKLKINDKTSLNVDDATSWTDQDAVVKITPKADSIDVNDLKGLYDDLNNRGYAVSIDLKPKVDKTATDESDEFSKQLSVYPDGTEVKFTLKQAE